jgi:hypothetical protein
MAVTTAIGNQFKLEVLRGAIHFGRYNAANTLDTFKWGLFKSATGRTYNGSTNSAKWADVTAATTDETSGTGYTTGGVATTASTSVAGTTTYVDFVDPQWTGSSFTASATALYDDSTLANDQAEFADTIVAFWDFGGDKTVSSGTFTIVLPTADTTNAILRFTS